MAMPLLVGPGVIANVILYATEAADRHRDGLRLELILATAVVCMLVFLVLASGSKLQRLLGDIGLSITQRVMGLFVAAIGVQFVVTGVVEVTTTQIIPKIAL
jgi:small neutral amino acid transporter SnatA (MarC family)